MFGGPVAPANRSGCRAAVSDLGYPNGWGKKILGVVELGSGSEEEILHSIEVNEMKGVSTALSSTAILPFVMECRHNGPKEQQFKRRFVSQLQYPGGSTTWDASSRPSSVDPNYRAAAELKHTGPNLDTAATGDAGGQEAGRALLRAGSGGSGGKLRMKAAAAGRSLLRRRRKSSAHSAAAAGRSVALATEAEVSTAAVMLRRRCTAAVVSLCLTFVHFVLLDALLMAVAA
nr:SPX and EXS domain-containing protein 1-like [Ipomoea batatas]